MSINEYGERNLKPSEVLRLAAKQIEDQDAQHNNFMCHKIQVIESGGIYKLNYSSQATEYIDLFRPTQASSEQSVWFKLEYEYHTREQLAYMNRYAVDKYYLSVAQYNDMRILALLFAAEIAESEGN